MGNLVANIQAFGKEPVPTVLGVAFIVVLCVTVTALVKLGIIYYNEAKQKQKYRR